MLKHDLSRKILNPDGTDVRVPSQEADGKVTMGPPLTLGLIFRTVLFAANIPDDKATEEEKFRRGMLGDRVWQAMHAAGDREALMEFEVDQLADIKRLVGKYYGPMIIHRVWNMIDEKKKTIQ